ncbi:MAG: sialidase family protein [Cyclobacteriaceae bacterium]
MNAYSTIILWIVLLGINQENSPAKKILDLMSLDNEATVLKDGKITSTGYWISDKAEDMPGLKTGPFVRLEDESILTIEDNKSLISKDEGQTWEEFQIFDEPDHFSIRPERVLIRTRSGVIILAFANDRERSDFNWQPEILDAPGAVLPTYAIRSLDGGKTWQDLQQLHNDWTGANRDIIETRDGNVIFTSMMMQHDPGHHSVVTYTTKDDGKTWLRSNVIDLGGIGHHAGVTEATIEQLRDGRIWMLMRTNWGIFWEAYSDNEGLRWKEFGPTTIDASSAPGLLKRLDSGRLMLVWNRVYPEGKNEYPLSGGDGIHSEVAHSNNREELSLMFSDDDGQNWSNPVVIARITEDSKVKRLAYPRVFEASPGEIWITTTYSGFGGYLSMRLFEKDFI